MEPLPPDPTAVSRLPSLRPARSLSAALTLLVSVSLLVLPLPAAAAPASEAEMTLYTRLAALNLCIARAAGVEFELAAGIASETISQWIQGSHQGAVAPVSPSPLSLEDLRRGVTNSALIGASEVCPDQLPAEVLQAVQEALRQAPAPGAPSAAP